MEPATSKYHPSSLSSNNPSLLMDEHIKYLYSSTFNVHNENVITREKPLNVGRNCDSSGGTMTNTQNQATMQEVSIQTDDIITLCKKCGFSMDQNHYQKIYECMKKVFECVDCGSQKVQPVSNISTEFFESFKEIMKDAVEWIVLMNPKNCNCNEDSIVNCVINEQTQEKTSVHDNDNKIEMVNFGTGISDEYVSSNRNKVDNQQNSSDSVNLLHELECVNDIEAGFNDSEDNIESEPLSHDLIEKAEVPKQVGGRKRKSPRTRNITETDGATGIKDSDSQGLELVIKEQKRTRQTRSAKLRQVEQPNSPKKRKQLKFAPKLEVMDYKWETENKETKLCSIKETSTTKPAENQKSGKKKPKKGLKGGPITCSVCNKSFALLKYVKRHMLSHSDVKPYQCIDCGKSFNLKESYDKHLRVYKDQVHYACSECKLTFRDKLMFERHTKTHDSPKPHICLFCFKEFPTSLSLIAHENTHINNKQFTCEICNQTFAKKYRLKRHMYVHTGNKLHKCPDCDKSFSENYGLTKHYATVHENLRPYLCITCGATYASKSTLNKHEESHLGGEQNKCDECGKCFKQQIHLQRHKLIHLNLRNFLCEYCSKSFTRKEHLKTHMETHMDKSKRPNFPCKFCSKSFNRNQALQLHIKKHGTTYGLEPLRKEQTVASKSEVSNSYSSDDLKWTNHVEYRSFVENSGQKIEVPLTLPPAENG